jgi:hypothetical protein
MSMEFGWWNRDPDLGKYQVRAIVHGGNIEWKRHQGHHTPWDPHEPTDDDRERLLAEAEKRLPRRLITQKQFDEIKRLSARSGPGRIAGRSNYVSPDYYYPEPKQPGSK